MSFIYPRIITIKRASPHTGAGVQTYGAKTASDEVAVVRDLSASIQHKRSSGKNPTGLPTDTPVSTHMIFFRYPTPGLVNYGDIVIDDLGQRYKVMDPYWNSLGYRLAVEHLKV